MRRILEIGMAFGLGLFLARTDLETVQAQEMPEGPGYMIVMGKGYEFEKMRPYFESLPPIYEKYEGSYMALTSSIDVLEGAYPYQSIIVSKWPKLQNAQDFWASPEYAEAIKLREGIGEFDVIAFQGLPAGAPE